MVLLSGGFALRDAPNEPTRMELAPPFAAVSTAPRLGPSPTWNFIPPHEEAAAAADRAAEWNSSLRPFDAFDVFLVDQMAVNGVRMERCQNHERTTRTRNARKATLRWEEDCELAAEELGAKLPRSPARVARKLRSTKQGCEWLRTRWQALGHVLESAGDWDEAQRTLALDLLGTPREFRAGPCPLVGDFEGRRELVGDQVGRLVAEICGPLAEQDASDREAAEMGFGPDHDGELASIRRFERTCTLRLEWARQQLRSSYRTGRLDRTPGRIDGEGAPLGSPAPASDPAIEEQWRAAIRAAEAHKTERPALEAEPVLPEESGVPTGPLSAESTRVEPIEAPCPPPVVEPMHPAESLDTRCPERRVLDALKRLSTNIRP